MNKIYDKYLSDIKSNNRESVIFRFIKNQSDEYNKNTNDKRKVIDFIAGMTDEMFLREIS